MHPPPAQTLTFVPFRTNAFYFKLLIVNLTAQICSLCTGMIIGDRATISVVIPLITQHWCPLIKYNHPKLYVGLQVWPLNTLP